MLRAGLNPRPSSCGTPFMDPSFTKIPPGHRAYALRWVGSEPGSAGYLADLSLMRARNWNEFRSGLERYKVPSENLVYADLDGNIGWQAGGLAPIRKNWSWSFSRAGRHW